MALFGVALAFAVFYSGVKLSLIGRSDALVSFVAMTLLSGFIFYFGMYKMAFKRISSRTPTKLGGSSPK